MEYTVDVFKTLLICGSCLVVLCVIWYLEGDDE